MSIEELARLSTDADADCPLTVSLDAKNGSEREELSKQCEDAEQNYQKSKKRA